MRAASSGILPDRVSGMASEQVLEFPARLFIPSARVDPRGLRPDPVGSRALAAAIQLGDPVQDGTVQRRQLLGYRVRLHPAQDDPDQGLPGIAQPSGPAAADRVIRGGAGRRRGSGAQGLGWVGRGSGTQGLGLADPRDLGPGPVFHPGTESR